jgi:hypothetical protein
MPAKVMVLQLWDPKPEGAEIVSTVSKSAGWQRGLSPFVLGPCKLYGKYTSQNMENGWQYAKVYKECISRKLGKIKKEYWTWAKEGWDNPKAVRYPMGKGRKPEFSLWDGQRLSYVEARKKIYIPLYFDAVEKTQAYKRLEHLYQTKKVLVLLDYDAYDHRKEKMTLTDVLENPHKKMGHAFVLAMMLTQDKALDRCW